MTDKTSWWMVPGKPLAVLSWEEAHLPSRFTASGHGSVGSPPAMWTDQYALPPVTGVLAARNLVVAAVGAGGWKTTVRVNAEVRWIPAKPADERVPAAATVVTVAVLPGMVVRPTMPAPVTITDPAKVHEIVTATDALPLRGNVHVLCPADLGESVRLTFAAEPGGPALAVAVASTGGCGVVNLTVNGGPQPPLSGGTVLARQALALAGLSLPLVGHGAPLPGGGTSQGGTVAP